MNTNSRTKVFWQLTNYCTAGCSYCPSKFWNGEKCKELTDYLSATETIINNYKSMGRDIDWVFTGGELLEVFDFPAVLKKCKEAGGNIEIETNGGKLWLDWWAIEPHIDSLHLTYHYWQNPNLIKFIIQAFQGKNKPFKVSIPLRPDYFDEDIARGKLLEDEFGIQINYHALFFEADPNIGRFNYSESQLAFLFGKEWVEANLRPAPEKPIPVTFAERIEYKINKSPVFTGKLCNVGIEYIRISPEGWISGSNCNNSHFGNLWDGSLQLPSGPAICKMQACVDFSDRLISKFDL
jgi:hypothetical protein